jgi:CheY-like chemotaxis protein
MHSSSSPAPTLVLIIDPLADTREMYAQFLQGAIPVLTHQVDSCEAAIRFCQHVRPHVIIADLDHPFEHDGMPVCAALRQRVGDVHVVGIASRLASAAPDVYDLLLEKPVLPDALIAALHARRSRA